MDERAVPQPVRSGLEDGEEYCKYSYKLEFSFTRLLTNTAGSRTLIINTYNVYDSLTSVFIKITGNPDKRYPWLRALLVEIMAY